MKGNSRITQVSRFRNFSTVNYPSGCHGNLCFSEIEAKATKGSRRLSEAVASRGSDRAFADLDWVRLLVGSEGIAHPKRGMDRENDRPTAMVSRDLAHSDPAFLRVRLLFKVLSVPPKNISIERTYLPRKFGKSWGG